MKIFFTLLWTIFGFGDACLLAGERPHRYIFAVYALDVKKLPLEANSQPALVGYMI